MNAHDPVLAGHDHSQEAKVWCATHQHTHIASIPRFTYLCKSCGWGQWYTPDARAHEDLCPGHETYEVEHVIGPMPVPSEEWEYGRTRRIPGTVSDFGDDSREPDFHNPRLYEVAELSYWDKTHDVPATHRRRKAGPWEPVS